MVAPLSSVCSLSRFGPHLGRSPRLLSFVINLRSFGLSARSCTSVLAMLSLHEASGICKWQVDGLCRPWSISATPGDGGRSDTGASDSMFQSETNSKLGKLETPWFCWVSTSETNKLMDCSCSSSSSQVWGPDDSCESSFRKKLPTYVFHSFCNSRFSGDASDGREVVWTMMSFSRLRAELHESIEFSSFDFKDFKSWGGIKSPCLISLVGSLSVDWTTSMSQRSFW